MNANELADELQACFTKTDWEYVNECAAMLRKQQEEIEYWKEKFDKAMALNDQVKYLEAQVYGGSTK
jgi:hypothetical protein